MEIKLRLKGPLKKYGPDSEEFSHRVERDSLSIKELIGNLGISASSVSFVSVDNVKTGTETVLKGGETVTIYPRVVGG